MNSSSSFQYTMKVKVNNKYFKNSKVSKKFTVFYYMFKIELLNNF